jgi:hypothetical protein
MLTGSDGAENNVANLQNSLGTRISYSEHRLGVTPIVEYRSSSSQNRPRLSNHLSSSRNSDGVGYDVGSSIEEYNLASRILKGEKIRTQGIF